MLLAEGVTAEEVERAVALIETDMTTALQSAGERADRISMFATLLGDAGLINIQSDRYRSVTADQVNAFAARKTRQGQSCKADLCPASRRQHGRQQRDGRGDRIMTTSVRPLPGPPREYHFPRFERVRLRNGMTVIIAPVRKLPVVSVAAVLDATAVDDPKGLEGLAELTAQALREGTKIRDGMKLALDFEKLGTSFEAGSDWDSTVASITVLKDKLTSAFNIFAEVLTLPAFNEPDIERLKAERLAERMQILAEPRGLADESFSRFVYAPDSRYGEPMSGSSSVGIKDFARGCCRVLRAEFRSGCHDPDHRRRCERR